MHVSESAEKGQRGRMDSRAVIENRFFFFNSAWRNYFREVHAKVILPKKKVIPVGSCHKKISCEVM